MAKVSIDVPTEKMQSFLQAIVNLGIDTRSVLTKRYRKAVDQKRHLSQSLKNMLFGWEYFSNELEYE
ncbi:hypothetical protein [Sediminibacterium soli]|uniref:hypothetical protein n=1 Tax=Sediminibacterium soli TaxID=2698829 RepID=UPI00137B7212|nr:hypothetical protein [Sediminibacterium soli]NCI46112.1 hypothetical protein [Sediminibacterium soli]